MTTRSSSATPDAASGKKKRKQPVSTVHRTLSYLRDRGALADIVERRLTGFVKKDLFGFADVLAVVPGVPGAVLLQVTVVGKAQEHLRAYAMDESVRANIQTVLRAGNRIGLIAWGKRLRADRRRTRAPQAERARATRWVPQLYVITYGAGGMSVRGPVPLTSPTLEEFW